MYKWAQNICNLKALRWCNVHQARISFIILSKSKNKKIQSQLPVSCQKIVKYHQWLKWVWNTPKLGSKAPKIVSLHSLAPNYSGVGLPEGST